MLEIHELRLDIELLLFTAGLPLFLDVFIGMGLDGVGSLGSLPVGFLTGGGCCGSGECGFADGGAVMLLDLVGDGGPSFCRLSLSLSPSSFGIGSGAEEALGESSFVPCVEEVDLVRPRWSKFTKES